MTSSTTWRALLAATPWPSLSHAYGDAGDVPPALEALTDPSTSDEGLEALFGGVLHQGTIYSCTMPAVRVVARMVAEGDVTDPDLATGFVLEYAASVADGWSTNPRYLPADTDMVAFDREARAALADAADVLLSAVDTHPAETAASCVRLQRWRGDIPEPVADRLAALSTSPEASVRRDAHVALATLGGEWAADAWQNADDPLTRFLMAYVASTRNLAAPPGVDLADELAAGWEAGAEHLEASTPYTLPAEALPEADPDLAVEVFARLLDTTAAADAARGLHRLVHIDRDVADQAADELRRWAERTTDLPAAVTALIELPLSVDGTATAASLARVAARLDDATARRFPDRRGAHDLRVDAAVRLIQHDLAWAAEATRLVLAGTDDIAWARRSNISRSPGSRLADAGMPHDPALERRVRQILGGGLGRLVRRAPEVDETIRRGWQRLLDSWAGVTPPPPDRDAVEAELAGRMPSAWAFEAVPRLYAAPPPRIVELATGPTPDHYPGQRAQALACELATSVPLEERWRTVLEIVRLGTGALQTAATVAARLVDQAPAGARDGLADELADALREVLGRPTPDLPGTEDAHLTAALALVDLRGTWSGPTDVAVAAVLRAVPERPSTERALRLATAVAAVSPDTEAELRERLGEMATRRERFAAYGDAADRDEASRAMVGDWLGGRGGPDSRR